MRANSYELEEKDSNFERGFSFEEMKELQSAEKLYRLKNKFNLSSNDENEES